MNLLERSARLPYFLFLIPYYSFTDSFPPPADSSFLTSCPQLKVPIFAVFKFKD
jgi:hypothetical protein